MGLLTTLLKRGKRAVCNEQRAPLRHRPSKQYRTRRAERATDGVRR
jgi:hypothetical protein